MTRTIRSGALKAAAAGVLVAVGMLALIAVALVEPAGAAFPGKNGKIAFTSDRDGNDEIYAMNANGTGLDRLTNNPAFEYAPAWSADGTRIAFTSYRDGNYEIYAMNANGTGLDRLTNNPADDQEPAWSADGTRIAFTSYRDDPKGEIYAMNANGTGLDRLTNNPAYDYAPDWQPLSPANPANTAPKVISSVPGANATGVAPAANITATFSKAMMASSINATTFKLFKSGSTTKVQATVNYSAATHKATLNPTKPLQGGATYRAVVTTGAKDLAGDPLDQDGTTPGPQKHKWLFTVS